VTVSRTAPSLLLLWLVGRTALPAQPTAVEDWVRALGDPRPDIRLAALRALGEVGAPEAIVPVAALLTDPDDRVRLAAVRTEVGIFVHDVRPSRRYVGIVEVRGPGGAESAFDRGPVVVTPRDAAPELLAGLARAIADRHPKIRLEAIYALGVVAHPPVAAATGRELARRLTDGEPAVRRAAARVIGRLDVKAGDALIEAMNDRVAAVRLAAMDALGDVREGRAVAALEARYTHFRQGAEAIGALRAMARIGSRSSVPFFASLLAARDPAVRRFALEGIGRAGDRSRVDAIETGLGPEMNEEVRLASAFALQLLGRSYVDRIVDRLGRPRAGDQAWAYLVELGPPIVPAIGAYLQSPEPGVRLGGVDALGVIGATSALPLIEPVVRDPDPEVAAAAARAILRIRLREPPIR
jgi:HEAT repeat protein